MWQGIALSMAPISEVRGGIPVAIAQGMNPLTAYVLCSIANMIVVPVVFFFLEYIHHHLLHSTTYQQLFDTFMEKTRKKVHDKITRYGVWGLCLFVAIPFPVTGAYTGTLAAWFFGINKKQAWLAISAGILISAAITTIITLGTFSIGGWR